MHSDTRTESWRTRAVVPYEIPAAQIDALLALNGTLPVNFDAALEQISIEKWLNHHQQNFEL